MPTRFVGLHLALVILLVLCGLYLMVDPCLGAGDLCLGGPVGLLLFGVAALGVTGIVIWRWRRRASLLLVLDSVLVAFTFRSALDVFSGGPVNPFTVGLQVIPLLGIPAAALAGREVVGHPFEATITALLLAGLAVYTGAVGLVILVIALIALAVGWLMRRAAWPAAPASPGEGAG